MLKTPSGLRMTGLDNRIRLAGFSVWNLFVKVFALLALAAGRYVDAATRALVMAVNEHQLSRVTAEIAMQRLHGSKLWPISDCPSTI